MPLYKVKVELMVSAPSELSARAKFSQVVSEYRRFAGERYFDILEISKQNEIPLEWQLTAPIGAKQTDTCMDLFHKQPKPKRDPETIKLFEEV